MIASFPAKACDSFLLPLRALAACPETSTRELYMTTHPSYILMILPVFACMSGLNFDLRTLFLLLLRQVQQQHASLHSTFACNLGTLSFLTAAMRNGEKSSTDSFACSD